jgi:hypothetical protein
MVESWSSLLELDEESLSGALAFGIKTHGVQGGIERFL